ncbi:hypothetical protein H2198_008705 [Neophaeococcomyces mojaviensis]|uniref:Uncharacterized protein n=1 Tax=Neophaeococcomyces mojaviensis TaxID=3383035 RepID=A0ACC2ZWV3_9EURO|nr:hypothetical protein H2198_008705 [Knufia sp. JES_112]
MDQGLSWQGQAIANYDAFKPPNNTHVTTADVSKRQRFHTTSVIGAKRSIDEIEDKNSFAESRSTTAEHATTRSTSIGQIKASKIVRDAGFDGEHAVHPYRPGSTPSVSQHPLLSLAHTSYDLPTKLVANFAALGVNAIYPWQSSCLMRSGVLSQSKNLVYTAPTGGGKSLVADVVLLRKVIQNPTKKALLVLPYVALVQEKTKWLRRLVEGIVKDESHGSPGFGSRNASSRGIIVTSFYGGSKSKTNWSDCDVAVCTIEKANLIVNSAIEEGTIDELGVVVCDELHMLDDEHRGYIFELMLTKLLTLQLEIQIIGMSATLENPEVLANWLQAKFFVAKYRPIPIQEYLVYDNAIYPIASAKDFLKTASQLASSCPTQKPQQPMHTIEISLHQKLSNPVANAVVALAVETAEQDYGALVFCNSRASSQAIAQLISEALHHIPISVEATERRVDVLASLQALPGGFEACFAETVPLGVGFHHAGLTIEEREIIAEAYDTGTLKVIVATCSLAAGINLPARRVILNSVRMGRDIVGPAMLRQMRGRAGRKGKDEIGETYLCCQKLELEPVAEVLEAELPAVVSCLTPERRGIKRAILEAICTRMLSTYESLQEYTRNSLLWHTASYHKMVLDMLDAAVTSLLTDKLISVTQFDTYAPTTLGSAIVASGLTPEDGLFVHADLRQALSSFVMDSEMHPFYLFTPMPHQKPSGAMTAEISWPRFRTLLEQLDEPSLRALTLIGVSPALVNRLANGGIENLPEGTAAELRTARIYRRVYSTFALRDICNEVPINTISLKYNLPRGTIQTLAQACHGFAAGMIKFCQRMATPIQPRPNETAIAPSAVVGGSGYDIPPAVQDPQASGFSMLAAVLEHMQSRLYASARADLLEMAQVTFVKGRMARLLYENGFRSVRSLSEADPKKDILPIMMSISGWKFRQIERDNVRHGKKGGGDVDSGVEGREGEVEERRRTNEVYEMRRTKLEEKLLGKAEVMVRSAAFIYEREVLRSADFEE